MLHERQRNENVPAAHWYIPPPKRVRTVLRCFGHIYRGEHTKHLINHIRRVAHHDDKI